MPEAAFSHFSTRAFSASESPSSLAEGFNPAMCLETTEHTARSSQVHVRIKIQLTEWVIPLRVRKNNVGFAYVAREHQYKKINRVLRASSASHKHRCVRSNQEETNGYSQSSNADWPA